MRTLNHLRDVWVFDNPDTMAREVFRQQHLITYFSAEQIRHFLRTKCPPQDYIQQMYVEDICGLGPWNEGKEWGDRIHKPFDPLSTEIWRE